MNQRKTPEPYPHHDLCGRICVYNTIFELFLPNQVVFDICIITKSAQSSEYLSGQLIASIMESTFVKVCVLNNSVIHLNGLVI